MSPAPANVPAGAGCATASVAVATSAAKWVERGDIAPATVSCRKSQSSFPATPRQAVLGAPQLTTPTDRAAKADGMRPNCEVSGRRLQGTRDSGQARRQPAPTAGGILFDGFDTSRADSGGS